MGVLLHLYIHGSQMSASATQTANQQQINNLLHKSSINADIWGNHPLDILAANKELIINEKLFSIGTTESPGSEYYPK